MRYVSIDIETTGLNPETCQILEFAAVIADTEDSNTPVLDLPFFRKVLKYHSIKGQPYGLYMNAQLLREIATGEGTHIVYPGQLMVLFKAWLEQHDIDPYKINVAGKNFSSFDRRFLEKLDDGTHIKFRQRVLDPAILYMQREDEVVPATNECLNRAGIDKSTDHTALADARLVVELLRRGMPHANIRAY